MIKRFSSLLLLKWVSFVQRTGVIVLVAVFALAFFAMRYTSDNLSMNTDTEDMLSEELVWRKLDQEYERLFPQYDNNILIVVEAATPDQAGDAAALLYERLQPEQALFEFVYYPNALSVFRESGLLYLDTAELQDLSDSLAEVQPFLAKLARDPSLRGLFGILAEALDAREDGEQVDINPILIRINSAIEALQDNKPWRMSWQELMSGEAQDEQAEAGQPGAGAGKSTYREFIVLQPKLDYAGFFPATPAIEKIHQLYEDLDIASSPGAQIRLTGATVLAHEEMLSVMKGTETAIVLALGLVTVIMLVGLGSAMLALVTVISLVTGLLFTAAFATLTIGELNLISVAFAVLYIGLGVDFAIHYCLRYREHLIDGADRRSALEQTSVNVGGSLFLCAASTAIGFFAFIPTDYTGVAELGWISGFGMFISFVVTLTVIPALLSLLPVKPGTERPARGCRLVDLHPGKILGGASFLALGSALLLSGIRFDHNTLNLHDQDGAALTTFRQLLADNDLTPWTGIMIAADEAQANSYREQLTRSDLVDKVVSIADFIPGNQDEKLYIIDEMSLLLGDLSVATQPDPETQSPAARLAAVRAFQEKLQEVRTDDPVMARLRANLAGLLEEQDPSLSTPFLRKQESTVRDSRLRGNGDGVDSHLRGNGDGADSHLRGNGDTADSHLRENGGTADSHSPGNLAGLLEKQDPSRSTPFLRKQESTVRDSRLRGNGDGVDSHLRGNGDTADSHLRENGGTADSHSPGNLAGLLEKQDPSLSIPFLRKQESTVRDSHLRGNGGTADSHSPGNGGNDAENLAQLEKSLLASLPGRLDALNASLYADYISLENLPAQLKQLWLSADGKRRIEIYPKQDMQDNAALREFVREIQSITPQVTGAPVNNLEASDAVAAAFKQAFLYAFIAITLMLYVLLARKRDVFLVLIPLLMAAVITGGISVLAGLPLNFANVIALPLLLGIGVDSGIHIIHRFRTDLPDGKNILATSSARAVVVSSLTTMGGVGNLALSPHAGTASMGMLLTLGIGVTLACMLLVLPALLTVVARSR